MGLDVAPAGERTRHPADHLTNPSAFCLDVEKRDETLAICIRGEFDGASVGRVEAALQRVAPGEIKRVVFDLEGLTFLDLAGLRAILRANERARSESIQLVVVRPTGLAKRVFTLTGAREQLTIVDRSPAS